MNDKAPQTVLGDDEAARLHALTGPCAISIASAKLGYRRRSCSMKDGTAVIVVALDDYHREVWVNGNLLGVVEL